MTARAGASGDTALRDITLNRASPIPLYYQLANQIEGAIDRGEIGTGYRLDNEIELADRLGVSRPTMRRAIQELVAKGLLVRKRGVGTQVVHNQLKRRVELSSLYDDLLLTEHRPTTRVVAHARVPADDDVALALGISAGDEVVEMRRLRSSDNEPLAILHNWLPVDIAPFTTEELGATGLYVLLRANAVNMRVARQRIGARAATAPEAKLLGTRKGSALVTMERTSYDDSGRAVELGRHVYLPEHYSFEVTLVSQ